MAPQSKPKGRHARMLLLRLVVVALMAKLSGFPCDARKLSALVEKQPLVLTYHKGQLLSGDISVNLVWYGNFTAAQRAIVSDFFASLCAGTTAPPSVAAWWATVEKYHIQAKTPKPVVLLGGQTLDESYSLGRRLGSTQLAILASKGGSAPGSLNVVLTAEDVAVEGFCMSRCGTHGSSEWKKKKKKGRYAYIWVGNSATQCPGQCAWPFHQPIYGPQTPPLLSPNADVGVDGMVINLAGLLAGAVTNPFGSGYFQGEKGAGLEAATACTGVFGKGAFPGYPGDLIVDGTTGGSYNANGVNGRKYLLPALVDPATKTCSTLV